MKVILSIVEYNTSSLLRDCLSSVFQSKISGLEVVVVDNASSDDSVRMVKKNFPQVKLIESQKNLGFGNGHNLVFKKFEADYYIILNSDAKIKEGVISKMLEFMKDHPRSGIASCIVFGFDGKLQPNGGDLPLGWALLGWLFNLESFGLKTSFHRNDQNYYKIAHQVGWVSGNFMIIKKDLLDKIGYFNEDYFMYFEDAELCYRAKKEHFEVWINPAVSIEHLSGGSLDDPQLRQWSGEMLGLVKFYHQQFGLLISFIIRLMVYFSLLLRVLAFALTGKLGYSKTYAKIISQI